MLTSELAIQVHRSCQPAAETTGELGHADLGQLKRTRRLPLIMLPISAIPLSPDTSDVAISSFSVLHGNTAGQNPAQERRPQQNQQSSREAPHRSHGGTATASSSHQQQQPPSQQDRSQYSSSSTAPFLSTPANATATAPANANTNALAKTRLNAIRAGDAEDGLFAVAMSPRSPDMAKSPFSSLSNT